MGRTLVRNLCKCIARARAVARWGGRAPVTLGPRLGLGLPVLADYAGAQMPSATTFAPRSLCGRWLMLGAGLAIGLAGCASQESFGLDSMSVLSEGVINDPANQTLRFDLLKFGLEQFCREMQQRGVALKLRDGEPTAGRFFASSCQSELIDDERRQSIIVRFAGKGYGWTNLTQRVGFEVQGLIEYAPDFQLHQDAMYIYFRPRSVDSNTFRTTLVESALANTGIAVTGVQPDQVGKDLVSSQLRRGFTVIRYSNRGETDFGMGYIAVGATPFRPFQVVQSDKRSLDNDRTEVHSGQQDYIGGFSVEESDQALFLTMTLDGASAVDVLLLSKAAGDTALTRFVSGPGPSTPEVVSFADQLTAGATWSRSIPVPPGAYYLLLDNSALVGTAAPPGTALDDRAARVDYLIQVGDRP
jgi:hypothetical protein